MNNIINIHDRDSPDREDIAAEARAWIVRLDGGRPGRKTLAEFQEWLGRSPLHREEIRRATAAWHRLGDLSGLLHQEPAPRPAAGRRGPLRFATAVLVLALGLGVGAYLDYRSLQNEAANAAYTATFTTAIGDRKSIVLPDGSRITLNTHSSVSVFYGTAARIVHLAGGEAWFRVAHNSNKPFIVYAGKYAVRDLGTAFSVRRRDKGIDLTVTDGRVEVADLTHRVPSMQDLKPIMIDKAESRVPLSAGQYAVFNQGLELAQRVKPAQIEKLLSWRDGRLIFDNDPLQKVVAEINRYTPVKIVISDPDIRNLRFGGYFRAGDVSSILATLDENFGIRVNKVNDHLIYLSRKR